MAHSFLKISLCAGFLLCLTTQTANCQAYNYRYGNSRVVQGAGGLAKSSSSYITGGTLSRSAQVGAGITSPYGNLQNGSSTGAGAGLTPGISGNNNLKSARMGSTVGMAGDYMRSDLNPGFSYQQQPRQGRSGQVRYAAPQQTGNQVATYGQAYQHNNSMPTGRQAVQIPINSSKSQTAATTGASASGSGSAASADFKGY